MSQSWKTDALWHLLFADALFLLLHYGGNAIVDYVVHGVIVLIGCFLVAGGERLRRVNPVYWICCGVVLVIGLIQLIPLPGGLFQILAPLKFEIVTAMQSVVPELTHSTEMAVTPVLHYWRLAVVALDMAVLLLLLMSAPPRMGVLRFWVYVFALVSGVLTVLTNREIADDSLLAPFREIHGGLANRNHFAAFSVVLCLLLSWLVLIDWRSLARHWRTARGEASQEILQRLTLIVFSMSCFLIVFYGFQNAWSRTAVVNLAVAFGAFGFLLAWNYARRAPWWAWVGAGAFALALVIMAPVGRGVEKFSEEGVDISSRIGFWRIGLDYLADGQILGAGLGASDSILEPREPKPGHHVGNARRFHNEYLQVAIELGIPGFVAMMTIIVLILMRLWSCMIESEHFTSRTLAAAMIALTVMVMVNSLIAFPLRITAMRLFFLLLVLFAVKQLEIREVWTPRRHPVLRIVPAVCVALLVLAMTLFIDPPEEVADNPQIVRAVNHGIFYRVSFFTANDAVAELLTAQDMDVTEFKQRIEETRSLILEHVHDQPFSVKAINLLFVLDILAYRLENPEFVRADFEDFETRAKRLRAFVDDANLSSRAALMTLYAAFEANLDDEERAEYEALRFENRRALRLGDEAFRERQSLQ